MKSVRLLPVVIAAGAALLVLKGVGLVTEGGYVLIGPSVVQAAGGQAAPSHADAAQPGTEPTMLDTSPTMDDGAPTLPLGPAGQAGAADAHGEPAAEGHLEPAEEHGQPAEEHGADAAGTACPPSGEVSEGHGEVPDLTEGCVPDPALDATGEAVPMVLDGAGNPVPLAGSDPASEAAVLGRLGDRRAELDAREAELDMRLALIEAAEQRIDERTAALEALESRIAAMVDEKKALEEEQFVAIVAMYETMKPRDAAAIFDQLELSVMLRVARAMSPRKMAPILAGMDPKRARDLTASMAIDRVEPTIDIAAEGLDGLPQIIGQ